MFEVKNKDTRTTSGVVLVFLLLTLNIFHTLLFSIVNLEQVNLVSIFCLAFNMSHLRLSRNKFWEPCWFQNVPKETYFIVVKFYKNRTKHPVFIKKILQWKNLLPSTSYAKDWGVAVLFNHLQYLLIPVIRMWRRNYFAHCKVWVFENFVYGYCFSQTS